MSIDYKKFAVQVLAAVIAGVIVLKVSTEMGDKTETAAK